MSCKSLAHLSVCYTVFLRCSGYCGNTKEENQILESGRFLKSSDIWAVLKDKQSAESGERGSMQMGGIGETFPGRGYKL